MTDRDNFKRGFTAWLFFRTFLFWYYIIKPLNRNFWAFSVRISALRLYRSTLWVVDES